MYTYMYTYMYVCVCACVCVCVCTYISCVWLTWCCASQASCPLQRLHATPSPHHPANCVCTCESTYIYMYTSMCTYMCVCVCVCVCVHSLSLPHSPHEYTHAPSGLIRRASWTREHTLTHSPSHTHTHTNSLSFSLKHTHLLSGPYREGLIDTNTHTHPLSHTHTHTLSLSLSLSNTHTHCMALIGRALWTRLPRLSWIPAQGNIVGVRGRFLPYTHIYIYAHMYICIYGDIRRRHRGF